MQFPQFFAMFACGNRQKGQPVVFQLGRLRDWCEETPNDACLYILQRNWAFLLVHAHKMPSGADQGNLVTGVQYESQFYSLILAYQLFLHTSERLWTSPTVAGMPTIGIVLWAEAQESTEAFFSLSRMAWCHLNFKKKMLTRFSNKNHLNTSCTVICLVINSGK